MGKENREIITAAGVQTILNIFQNKPVIDLKCNDLPPDNVAVENYKFSIVSPVARNRWNEDKWIWNFRKNCDVAAKLAAKQKTCEKLQDFKVYFGKTNVTPSQKQLEFFDERLKHFRLYDLPGELYSGQKTRSLYRILGILLDNNGDVSSLAKLHKLARKKKCEITFLFLPTAVRGSWKTSAHVPSNLVKAYSGKYFPEYAFNWGRINKTRIHPSIAISKDANDRGILVEIFADKNFIAFDHHHLQMNETLRQKSPLVEYANSHLKRDKIEVKSGSTHKTADIMYEGGCLYYKDGNRRLQTPVDSSSTSDLDVSDSESS
eukprot:GHVP01029546.1.p1 GENE.GHVP01029546.1~~GHVP01029546.1.p1  ORF type:complete len:319 (+),score=49.31 GHVP01029546.1:47-1003(+)